MTGPVSRKARHIPADGRVAVTVPVRRGGILPLVAPVPPATISFHATAIVHSPNAPAVRPVVEERERCCHRSGRSAWPSSRSYLAARSRPTASVSRWRRCATSKAKPHARTCPLHRKGAGNEHRVRPRIQVRQRRRGGRRVTQRMAARGVSVSVHHIRDVSPTAWHRPTCRAQLARAVGKARRTGRLPTRRRRPRPTTPRAAQCGKPWHTSRRARCSAGGLASASSSSVPCPRWETSKAARCGWWSSRAPRLTSPVPGIPQGCLSRSWRRAWPGR